MSVLGSLWAAIIRVANRNEPLVDAVFALPLMWGNEKAAPHTNQINRETTNSRACCASFEASMSQ